MVDTYDQGGQRLPAVGRIVMRQRIATCALAVIAAIAVIGCSNTAAPATGGASAGAGPSQLVPSLAIPSVELPSGAKELEALLPATMCGQSSIKTSLSGDAFATSGDEELKALMEQLGKTPADVSFAAAIAGASGCTATIFRVNGADTIRLHDVFVAEVSKEGPPPTEKTIGGKTVLVGSDVNKFGYAYFKDDTVILFTAPDEAKAGEIAAALP
jgi:hypothetical protein